MTADPCSARAVPVFAWPLLIALLLFVALPSAGLAAFGDPPMLQSLVSDGAIQPAQERLPRQPLVVQPVKSAGTYGGTWRMGLRGNRDHALLLRTLGYENLVRWSPTWQHAKPNIALRVVPTPDYTAYTFYLRRGMRWSDGAPFTADDILFWYEDVYSNPELSPTQPTWLASGGKPVVVEKVDDATVVFRFAAPYGLFLQQLAHPLGAEPTSYPKHYLKAFHPNYSKDNVAALMAKEGHATWKDLFESRFGTVGNIDHPSRWRNHEMPTLHAWVLDQGYSGDATRLTASRNPYYWKIDPLGNQLPYIDTLEFTVGDQAQLEAWAVAGKLDMQNRHISSEALRPTLEAGSETGGYTFFRTIPGQSSYFVFMLNLTHKDPATRALFQDLRFRKAMSLAIDRDARAKAMTGQPAQPYQAAPRPESPFYNEKLATQYTAYDPETAAQLLDALGCAPGEDGFRRRPDGAPLRIVVATEDSYVDVYEPLAAMWRDIGLDVTIDALSRADQYKRIRSNDHDASVAAGEGGLDVLLEHQHYLPVHTDCFFGVGWRHWMLDPAAPLAQVPPEPVQRQIELYSMVKATGDQAEQAEYIKEILRIAADQFYVMGLFLGQEGYGLVSKRMRNVPEVMPNAWSYPTPAPTNPSQYSFGPETP